MILTRQEKEKLVLDLYNQGKTYRGIAKDARMCPRDIGAMSNFVCNICGKVFQNQNDLLQHKRFEG